MKKKWKENKKRICQEGTDLCFGYLEDSRKGVKKSNCYLKKSLEFVSKKLH